MKDKEKQIVELAKLLNDKNASIVYWDYYNDDYNPSYKKELKNVASIIYNAGYRKLPEDSVVLSREECEKLYYKGYNNGKQIAEKFYKPLVKAETSKETAEKILKDLWAEFEKPVFWADNVAERIKELAKQFGVEIKE